jgi:hypothetical protein
VFPTRELLGVITTRIRHCSHSDRLASVGVVEDDRSSATDGLEYDVVSRRSVSQCATVVRHARFDLGRGSGGCGPVVHMLERDVRGRYRSG